MGNFYTKILTFCNSGIHHAFIITQKEELCILTQFLQGTRQNLNTDNNKAAC